MKTSIEEGWSYWIMFNRPMAIHDAVGDCMIKLEKHSDEFLVKLTSQLENLIKEHQEIQHDFKLI